MFPFTISYTSKIRGLNEAKKTKVLVFLRNYIEESKGKDVSIVENTISFRSGFFGWSWDKFAAIEKGVFYLKESKIKFKFYMYRLFIIVTLMSGLAAIGTHKYFVGIFFFAGLGLGNWIIAVIKFRTMTTEIAREVDNLIS